MATGSANSGEREVRMQINKAQEMGAKRSEVGLLKTKKKTSVRTSEFMNDYRNEQTNECSKESTSD